MMDGWDKKHIASVFSKVASHYDESALLQLEVADRLFERIKALSITPGTMLDVGSGTGALSEKIKKHYPLATLIELDVAEGMLQHSKQHFSSSSFYVCGDAEAIPFASHTMEIVFSNLMLQWSQNLTQCFQEFARVMTSKGQLLFTTLGVDTFKELRSAWADVDDGHHVHDFLDMHVIGDLILAKGFIDPVFDREFITVYYDNVMDIMHDIKKIGAYNRDPRRSMQLTGKSRIKKMMHAYDKFRVNNKYPVTYEIIYGYAKAPQGNKLLSDTREVRIPVSAIGKIKR